MPITINGSGTVTGINAGGLPDGCVTTDDLAANAVTTAKLGSNEQSGLCKAWVNFNGTGTVAIRASYNVSSITDNGTGDYTVNFTTALADANYSACASGDSITNGNQGNFTGKHFSVAPTTSAFRLTTYQSNLGSTLTQYDQAYVYVAIFR